MPLPVCSCLETSVTAHHVLIQLLGHIEVGHTYQVTAVLENKITGRKRNLIEDNP